jgi:hypothetical protein
MPIDPSDRENGIIGPVEDHIIKYTFKNHPRGISVQQG